MKLFHVKKRQVTAWRFFVYSTGQIADIYKIIRIKCLTELGQV